MRDLAVLAADKMIEYALRGLLGRRDSLGLHPVEYTIWTHPEHDPGCRERAHQFLRPFAGAYRHALVIFDRRGCGSPEPREEMEARMEGALAHGGWGNRAAAIAIDPELEAWVWSDSPHVPEAIGWTGRGGNLRGWLDAQGLWRPGEPKPHDPKEALRIALRKSRRPHSATLFRTLAEHVSVRRCEDPSFVKLRETLARWFAR